MIKVAFDVDGTLIQKDELTGDDTPRYSVLQTMFLLKTWNCEIYVWSGSGLDYATRWTEKLGIASMVRVIPKASEEMDLVFDDEQVNLGKVNIQV